MTVENKEQKAIYEEDPLPELRYFPVSSFRSTTWHKQTVLPLNKNRDLRCGTLERQAYGNASTALDAVPYRRFG